MEFTVRDAVYLLVFLGSLGGLYVGIVTRLTRLEALVHRVTAVEGDVEQLRSAGEETGRAVAALQAEFVGAARARRK